MNIAGELEKHAAEELSHALIIAKQIDYLGGMPAVEAKNVRTSEKSQRDVAVRSRKRNGNDSKLPRASSPVRGVSRVCHERANSRDLDRRTRPPNCSGDGSGQERSTAA